MSVRPKELPPAVAWGLLCGSRELGEAEPISVSTAELLAQWRTWREPLLAYWADAVDWPTEGWPNPVAKGPCWAQLVLEEGVDDDEARRRIDTLMGWPPADAPGTYHDGPVNGTAGGDD